MGYEEQADRLATIMQNPKLKMNTDLLVDGTGIGDAAVELIRKRGLYPIPIIFSGGETHKVHNAAFEKVFGNTSWELAGAKVLDNISVPKKDLVDAGKVMLESGRLRIAPVRWNADFQKQLQKFKGKVNERTKNIKYEAETEQDHDDLVVCFLMGSWYILHRREKGIPEQTSKENQSAGWEPMDYC